MPGASLLLVLLVSGTLVAAPAARALAVPVIGGNLIANGSFEESPLGPVPAGQPPEGWAAEAYGGNGQLAIVAGGAPGEGQQCVQMTAGFDDSTGLHGPFLEIDPTQAYVQCGWIRLDGRYESTGMSYGRQWFDAEQQPLDLEKSRSYNYVISGANPGPDWQYYEQLLLPDPTPDDGAFRADEIPAAARYLRVWALAYRWDGVGCYDGLGLYRVDYAALVRPVIEAQLAEADVDALRAEITASLRALPADLPAATRAGELLDELSGLQARLVAEGERPVLEWIADRDRTPALLIELNDVRWELKTEALLRGV